MNPRFKGGEVVEKCGRCGRRVRNPQGWNVVYSGGRRTGVLCPGCQTVEEDLEAQVNETLTEPNTWQTTSDPDRITELIAQNIARRVERTLLGRLAEIVATQEAISGEALLDEVEASVMARMPAWWVESYGGDMAAAVRSLARDLLYLDADEQDEGVGR